MTTDKAYEIISLTVSQMIVSEYYEIAEVTSMALETLYEKAKDYDNMLIVAMEQQVARKELEELTF